MQRSKEVRLFTENILLMDYFIIFNGLFTVRKYYPDVGENEGRKEEREKNMMRGTYEQDEVGRMTSSLDTLEPWRNFPHLRSFPYLRTMGLKTLHTLDNEEPHHRTMEDPPYFRTPEKTFFPLPTLALGRCWARRTPHGRTAGNVAWCQPPQN